MASRRCFALVLMAAGEGFATAEESLAHCGQNGCAEDGDSAALLQMHQASPWPTNASHSELSGPLHSTGSCTGGNGDPWSNGFYKACCTGLEKCLDDWWHTNTWSWRCLKTCSQQEEPTPAPAPAPADTDLSICKARTAMTKSSIWQVGTGTQSCSSSKGIRGDGAYSCQSETGDVDATSIYVDMRSLSDKVGCFEWIAPECSFPMRSVRRISFDVEWKDCDDLWMAPLWTFSNPWKSPQGTSGEIDFVEACPVPKVSTNLGCYDPWSGNTEKCMDAQHWGEGSSSDGPQHVMATFTGGDLKVEVCTLDRQACKVVATYMGYLDSVYPTSKGRNNVYHFVSDIWNDKRKDGGWNGCHAVRNVDTNCRYAITNIQVESNSAEVIFGDISSSCQDLNPPDSRGKLGRYGMPLHFNRNYSNAHA